MASLLNAEASDSKIGNSFGLGMDPLRDIIHVELEVHHPELEPAPVMFPQIGPPSTQKENMVAGKMHERPAKSLGCPQIPRSKSNF